MVVSGEKSLRFLLLVLQVSASPAGRAAELHRILKNPRPQVRAMPPIMYFFYFATVYSFDYLVLPGSGTAGIDSLSALWGGEGEGVVFSPLQEPFCGCQQPSCWLLFE